MKQSSSIITTQVVYRGKIVNAKIITVKGILEANALSLFNEELLKSNYIHLAKPMADIRFTRDNEDSVQWQQGSRYEFEIKLFGWLNTWGTHHLKIVSIIVPSKTIITEQRNKRIKIWNYDIKLVENGDSKTELNEEVIVYAGRLTGILARFLAYFYKRRQQNLAKLIKNKN